MIDRLFKKVSYVQIMVNTAASIAMIVDNVVIGKFLGVTAVAAYGLVAPLLLIFMAISQVLSTGGQIKCSEELGAGNRDRANGAASLTVILGLIFSILSVILCVAFQNQIAMGLGATNGTDLFSYTIEYLLGFMIGAPGFIGVLILTPFIQLDGDKRCVLVATIVMTVMDIVGDVAVVLLFSGGMFGIGIASSLSYYCALVILISHFLRNKGELKFGLKDINFKNSGEIFKSGAPAALQKLLRTMLSLVLNHILIAFGGTVVLGTFTIINSILNLFNSSGQGMGAGTLLLTRLFFGSEDRQDIRDTVKSFIKTSIVINGILIVLIMIFAYPLVQLFSKSGDIDLSQASMALRIASIDLIFFALTNCFNKYYQGTKRQIMTYVITIAEAFLFSAVAAYPLMRGFGIFGICSTFAVGDLLTLVMICLIVSFKNKSGVISIDNLLLLPENFGVDENDCYIKSVESINDAEEASQEISDFVKAHLEGAEAAKIQMRMSLCVEEICSNIINYGFSPAKKNHLEVKAICKSGHITVRIRDDCKKYNPQEFYKQYIENNKEEFNEKYGLSLVFGLMEDINYFGTLGINTLIINS